MDKSGRYPTQEGQIAVGNFYCVSIIGKLLRSLKFITHHLD